MKVVGVYSEFFPEASFRLLPAKMVNVIRNRSNPRSKEYMRTQFLRKFPNGFFVEAKDLAKISPQNRYVLLYSDTIGIGFQAAEKKLLQSGVIPTVLNGRGRLFVLNAAALRRLRFKRILEVTFLPELLAAPLLILLGLTFAVMDFAKGRT